MKIPIVKNTVTNFISMFVRLAQGILIARWLIARLGKEQYGLWSMIWVFFSFALLLDLGFGVAAQKTTATEMWKTDIARYNKTISSIFCAHLLMSLLIIPLTLTAIIFVRPLFHLPPDLADVSFYRTSLLICGLSTAAIFPLGVFQEILVGLHKLYLRNYIEISFRLLDFIGIIIIFLLDGGLISLIVYTVIIIGGCTQLTMMFFVYQSIPGFRIRPWFNRQALRGILDFSISAYLVSLGRLIWDRSAPLMISIFCGLTPVGLFHLGARLPLLLQQLAGPYLENLSPIAARLHARNRRRSLSSIQCHLIRCLNYVVAGISVAIFLTAPKLLYLLFHVDSAQAVLICRLMMILVYILIIFRLVPEKSLIMTGEHHLLARTLLLEDGLFLISALLLMQVCSSELSVILSMLFTKSLSTALFITPRFFRLNPISRSQFFIDILGKPLVTAIITGALAFSLYQGLLLYINEWICLLLSSAAGGLLYLAILYKFIFNRIEKLQIHTAFNLVRQKLQGA